MVVGVDDDDRGEGKSHAADVVVVVHQVEAVITVRHDFEKRNRTEQNRTGVRGCCCCCCCCGDGADDGDDREEERLARYWFVVVSL